MFLALNSLTLYLFSHLLPLHARQSDSNYNSTLQDNLEIRNSPVI
jgi:hypothetical protein